MRAYYNENNAYAAAWLRNLIEAGYIAGGEVDERSIADVRSGDLAGFTQCHFFAGIGVWSYVLRRAGWPDDRPVWTGSCPCQPFSGAGAGRGFDDERHLWPIWNELIRQCRPADIFGEQVASPDGLVWLNLVQTDLERANYAVAATDLCAAGIGAPHIRQRLYWMADADSQRCQGQVREAGRSAWNIEIGTSDHCTTGGMADANGRHASAEREQRGGKYGRQPQDGSAGGLGDASSEGAWRDAGAIFGAQGKACVRSECDGIIAAGADDWASALTGFWAGADWLFCTDGWWRPVEPGTFPLAHGATSRVGRLRAYGNAICAPQAEIFVRATMQAIDS